MTVQQRLGQIFIYGTLIPGEERWPLIEEYITSIEPDSTPGLIYDTGAGFPAARFDGTATISERIRGLRMTIDDEVLEDCLELLDEIESAVTGLYHRLVVDTDSGHAAWAYQYGTGLGSMRPIRSGSWTDHINDVPIGEFEPPASQQAQGWLNFVETRVIGSLIEKSLTTPQNYPLSMNALLSACNQSSSRDPISDLSEAEVMAMLTEGKERRLIRFVHPRSGHGVTKYRHVLDENLGLDEHATAVLGVLMLRGPQTARELRDRTERMVDFGDTTGVEAALMSLSEDGHVMKLDRQVGQRDERWIHLLAGRTEEA